MPPRRSHKKSRNGCLQCKRRKLKCNEQKPQCANCISHAIDCEYAAPQTVQLPSPSSSDGRRSAASRQKDLSSSLTPSNSAFADTLNKTHLELIYHYSSHTCWTLAPDPEEQRRWQRMPELAWSNEFLLHCLLAVSAQHLSYLREDGNSAGSGHFAQLARHHQDLSFKSAQPALANVTPDNSAALCAYSAIVPMLTFASKTESAIIITNDAEHSASWLHLVRGAMSFFLEHKEWIKSNGIGEKVEEILLARGGLLPAYLEQQLDKLDHFCCATIDGEDAKSTYQLVLGKLRWAFSLHFASNSQSMMPVATFMWPATIPASYLSLLDMKRPEALAILAHFAVILSTVDSYWWGHGMALRLATVIQEAIPDPWKSWAQWPMDQITTGKPLVQLFNGH